MHRSKAIRAHVLIYLLDDLWKNNAVSFDLEKLKSELKSPQ